MEKKILQAIKNSGVQIDEYQGDLVLNDVLVDSLIFVSFFIEIEQLFDIEIPDEYYTQNLMEKTLDEFSLFIKECQRR